MADMRSESRMLNLEGAPTPPSSPCMDHHWTLTININKIERVVLRALDGVETDHPGNPIHDRVFTSFFVPVSVFQAGPHSWQRHLEHVLTSFGVPSEQSHDFASRIMSRARALDGLCQGQGRFSVEADLELAITWVFPDVEDGSGLSLRDFEIVELLYAEDEDWSGLDYEPAVPGASSDAISKLVEQGFSATARGQYGNCTICLDGMAGDGKLARMPCKHVFHSHCIARWLETSNSCPICRDRLEENT